MLQMDFSGDHNLGLFAKANDRVCLIGNFVEKKELALLQNKLKVKIFQTDISNTDLVGIFCALNSNGIVLPKIIKGEELEFVESFAKKEGMNIAVLKTKFTAIGNTVLCNDKGAVISQIFSRKDKETIETCLDVRSEYSTIAGMETVGSAGLATNKGCLLHRDASESELEKIESVLKVPADIGTANFGSPFIGSCLIANSHDLIVGESTTGPEIARAQEALGFL